MGQRRAVMAIFVMSGAAGLVYEIVWARQLVLVFGNTAQAISAILTGFFAGLAAGSVIGGRVADRVRSALRLYGFLEVALVAVVLATPGLFRLLHEVYRSAFGWLEASPALLTPIRFGLALVALAPATVLMGATLPMLSRYLARRSGELGQAFGHLYTANTIGALLGTLVAGFVLIEVLGLSMTLLLGAVCSGTAGLLALWLDRRMPRSAPVVTAIRLDPQSAADVGPLGPSSIRRLALVVAFVSGLTSLGYQVLWTRLLASGTGNSTYVFTIILALFLLGIAFGAAVVSARPPRPGVVGTLGAVQTLIGALALVGVALIGRRVVDLGFLETTLVAVLPATMTIGLSLPLASHLVASGDARVGRDTGLLLAVNTTGVIVATVGVPFGLIPLIGSPSSLLVLALVNIALGLLLIVAGRPRGSAVRRAPIAVGLFVATCGAAALVVGPLAVDPSVSLFGRLGTLWASAEDEIASVQAGMLGQETHLFVAGTGMTALTVDARLMPVLPTMLRPSSSRLLVVAFGMGSSYREGLILGHQVDGVELVPSVPRMFRYYFADADAVLADPRGRLIITDGRNHVELTNRTYDIVVVDPPPPIRSSGTAVLYSREFYAASASRLRPGGVMMEWIPYDDTVDDFRAHVRTFRDVFSNAILAFGPGGAGVFMLGSEESLQLDGDAIRGVLRRPGVLDDLSSAFDSPEMTEEGWAVLIPSLVWAAGEDVGLFAGSGPLITDDRPLTEYFLLRRLFGAPSPPMTPGNLLDALAAAT